MTEIFKRKYGNSAGKLEDWIYQRSLTQFIPPRVGWDSRNIFFQPPANRDHPPWSLEAISPFLPPSLVSTTPELPWSSVARHLLAAAASDHFSAYHTLSPRSSSHSLQWHSLTALSSSLRGHCCLWMGLWWHQGSSFPSSLEPGERTWGRESTVRSFSSPALLSGYSPGCSSVFLRHFCLLPTKAHFLWLISEAVGDADAKPVL